MMINTAKKSRELTIFSKEILLIETLNTIKSDPQLYNIFEYINKRITDSIAMGYYTTIIKKQELIEYEYKKSIINKLLSNLGYKVDFSYSSNPDNKRMSIHW